MQPHRVKSIEDIVVGVWKSTAYGEDPPPTLARSCSDIPMDRALTPKTISPLVQRRVLSSQETSHRPLPPTCPAEKELEARGKGLRVRASLC